MPKDSNGHELHEGDRVLIEGRVRSVQDGTDYANVVVETDRPSYPGTTPTAVHLNSTQVTKLLVASGETFETEPQEKEPSGTPTESSHGREGAAG